MNKEYLLEMYKIEAAKYASIREINWRINTSYATVLILAIYGKVKGDFSFAGVDRYWQLLIYTGCILLQAILIYRINSSFRGSLTRMNNIASYLLDETITPGIKLKEIIKVPVRSTYTWQYLMVGITILLIFVFDISKPVLSILQKLSV
jgi:hypothetical protein